MSEPLRLVYPRLPPDTTGELFLDLHDRTLPELAAAASYRHPSAATVPVGGTGAPEERIVELARQVRAVAASLGFPEPLGQNNAARFDAPVGRLLHETMLIVPSDAAAEGVWSFLSLVVLPEVAAWRFPSRSERRLRGGPRNVFRRCWWRAEVIGSDLIDVPGGLGEDELVNIMERPSIAADHRLARTLASEVVALPAGAGARSEVMRDSAKRVLRVQALLCLDVLSDAQLRSVVSSTVQDAVVALRSEG